MKEMLAEIGERLKFARVKRGLSQKTVAKQLGITWETLSRYEHGKTAPFNYINELAAIYKQPVEYFVGSEISKSIEQRLDKLLANIDNNDRPLTFHKYFKPVIRVINKLSGGGITADLETNFVFKEITSELIEKHEDQLFGINASAIKLENRIKLINTKMSTLIFAKEAELKKGEYCLAFDGVTYKLAVFDPKDVFTPLAKLVAIFTEA
jgi:transcriptional regulator with XRE-family HTH domain